MLITASSDSENIRIYFNTKLHLRIPRNENIIIKSYVQINTRMNYIEIKIPNNFILLEYEDENIWKEVLNLLDKHI
jgi:hypothetical protein